MNIKSVDYAIENTIKLVSISLRFFWKLLCFITLLLVLLVGIYVLSPRQIEVTTRFEKLDPYEFETIKDKNGTAIGMVLYFEEKFHIKNVNYYNITLRDLELKFKRHSHANLPKLSYEKHLVIPAMSEKSVDVQVKYTLYIQTDPHVDLCIKGILFDLHAGVHGRFSFRTPWTRDQPVEIKEDQYIMCQNSTAHPIL